MLLETIKELELLTEKKIILVEAIDSQTVLNFLNFGAPKTLGEILTHLGIQPSMPPNGQQVAVYNVLKKGMKLGTVKRAKEGKSFKYSKGDGKPQFIPTKMSKASPEELLKVINANWYERGERGGSGQWESEGGKQFVFHTDDRGPRTDHGGPPDGDGWMEYDQIQDLRKSYAKKWDPKLKQLAQTLKTKKISVKNYYTDYGEKGHVYLLLNLE